MADRFPLVANSGSSQIQEIPNGDTLDLSGNNVKGVGIITATTFSGNVTGNASGTSGGLSGTPNITVQDATVQGNLTVNGTTTTIDTAVTAVDSLAVDGNITSLGRLGIGTDNTSADVLTVSGVDAFIRVDRSNGHPGIDLRYQGSSTNRAKIDVTPTGDLRFTSGGGTERLRILADGTVATGSLNSTPGTVAAGSIVQAAANAGFFTNGYDGKFGTSSNHPVYIQVNGSSKLTIATNGDLTSTGTISDSIGPLRNIPLNNQQTNASYTLVASDAGKLVHASGTTSTVVIPNGVFGVGNAVTILNGDGSNTLTISQGSGFSLRNTADSSTGNRTLAVFGMATIYFTGSGVGYISGAGLS